MESSLQKAGGGQSVRLIFQKYEFLFAKNGYVLNETVRAVFREFGDLDVQGIPSRSDSIATSSINFSLADEIEDIPLHCIRFLERFINGERLIPIASSNPTRISISNIGKIYCFDDDPFRCCGESIEDFLHGLYDGRVFDDYRVVEISDENWDQYYRQL